MKAIPTEERLWLRVKKGADDECWLWTGALCGNGYGAIRAHRQRASLRTHRLSYEMHHGPIPDGMHVLHRCDNPRCVNPRHLWLGTHQDNMDDKAKKGRTNAPQGERSGNAKLTEAQVRAIRAAAGYQEDIGARFGVSQTTVWRIKSRASWAHVR